MAVPRRSELIDKKPKRHMPRCHARTSCRASAAAQRRAAISPAMTRRQLRLGDVRGQEIEPVLEPKLTRDAALNFAAGRLRQRARTDKHHVAS
jgi:hypothetical protein